MGEAKRRREAAKRVIQYRDSVTGERVTIRAAGDPVAFQRKMGERGSRLLAGDRSAVNADVPCDGCRQCCYHLGVDVHPERETPETLAHLQTERRENGGLYLRKREDGACVHLGPEGCTVYEHRPIACRSYDCRVYALINVLDRFDGDRVQQRWTFQPRNREGAAFLAACQMTGRLKLAQADREGGDCSANAVAEAVFTDPATIKKATEAFLELMKLSPDQLTKTLGFDPRAITPEQLREASDALSGGRSEVFVRASDDP